MAITNISALWDLDSSTRVFDYLNSSGNEIIQVQNFIENQFIDPEHTPRWINSFAPRSGKVRAIVPRSPPNIVEYAVNVASQAFSTWSKSSSAPVRDSPPNCVDYGAENRTVCGVGKH